MSDWYNVDFAPQGWQCPICKRVYSPTTPMCYYCGNLEVKTNSTFTIKSNNIDWVHHDSITNTEDLQEGKRKANKAK